MLLRVLSIAAVFSIASCKDPPAPAVAPAAPPVAPVAKSPGPTGPPDGFVCQPGGSIGCSAGTCCAPFFCNQGLSPIGKCCLPPSGTNPCPTSQ